MSWDIVDYLTREDRAVGLFELSDALDAPVEAVDAELRVLMQAGRVMTTKKGRYALPETLGLIPARTLVTRGGTPFARPLDGSPDMKISRSGEMRAMHGDEIYVRVDRRRARGEQAVCELVAVTKRVNTRLIAVLKEGVRRVELPPVTVRRKGKKKTIRRPVEEIRYLSAQPCDPHMVCGVEVVDNSLGARVGETVCLEPIDWPRKHTPLKARVVRVLGDGNDLNVQMQALIESRNLSETFPQDVQAEAKALKEPDAQACEGRFDARSLTVVTIDGEDAKDFDDAVSLEKTPSGWQLGVHIADVSHYVAPGSAIDREALARGTSVYLPGRVLPMLPEQLCNDLCSLRPEVDRLAMSLFMQIEQGEVVSSRLESSVIHSSARLTYEAVNRLFDGEENDVPEALHAVLRDMDALARTMRARRQARGSIDFELAEPQFTLDEHGYPLDVRARVRGEAERMIEDFMLAANEAVAEKARLAHWPLIYRVHEKPDADRLASLELFLNNVNQPFHIGREPQPKVLSDILRAVEGKKEAVIVKSVMLRSLKRACYSDKPLGHYALALRDYCHFTSPIRRYPDLIVHRMMKMLLAGQGEAAQAMAGKMPDLAAQTSRCEYEASCLERDADDLVRACYMKPHVGELFDAVVTSVTSWGFFVELDNTADGLVRGSEPDEDYFFDEDRQCLVGRHSRRVVRPGDRVRVRLDSADVAARELTFTAIWPEGWARRS